MTWFPIDESAHSLADEAEITALTSPSLSCSLEDFRSALHQSPSAEDSLGGDLELAYRETTDDSNEDGVGPDAAEDEAIADASEELQRRSDVIGRGYPFTFDGIVLTASDTWANEAIAYVFLLLLSAPGLPGKTEGRRLFEEVVTAALAQYLAGESLRFGFPYRHPVPSHPNEALNYLAKQMGQPRLSTRQVRASEKDMGVDAVAWKPFSDSRSSKVVLLANCSTGTDWNSKLGELNIEKWKRMIDFGCNPVQAFAVPWIPNYEDWADIVDYGNMVVDRARVASLLFHWNASPTIQRWCAKRLQEAKTL